MLDAMVSALYATRYVAALAYGMQWLVFALHAAPYQSEKFYDLTGSLTYFACTLSSLLLNDKNLVYLGQRQQLVSLCLLVWSGRLGLFLYSRISRDGVDRRFNRMRTRPLLFLVAWTIQASTLVVCLGPAGALGFSCARTPVVFSVSPRSGESPVEALGLSRAHLARPNRPVRPHPSAHRGRGSISSAFRPTC